MPEIMRLDLSGIQPEFHGVLTGKVDWHIEQGNALEVLPNLPDCCIQAVITSPPYWGLRNYDLPATFWHETEYIPMPGLPSISLPAWEGCLGLEPTPELYVAHMVQVFRELWRVLRPDGTVWLNLGDSYVPSGGEYKNGSQGTSSIVGPTSPESLPIGGRYGRMKTSAKNGLTRKNLTGIPWRVAFAMQADGWFLRMDNIWNKLNPIPESIQDRPTKAHEYLFLLAKSSRYYYDNEAIRDPLTCPQSSTPEDLARAVNRRRKAFLRSGEYVRSPSHDELAGRNKRSVWTVPSNGAGWDFCMNCKTFFNRESRRGISLEKEEDKVVKRCVCGATDAWVSHFAMYPPELIRPAILAGSSGRACQKCGAPWERVTEKGEAVPTGHGASARWAETIKDYRGKKSIEKSCFTTGAIWQNNTVGWRPTCKCPENDGSGKSIILDPFSGGGTTVMESLRHGRAGIGIELNNGYKEMSRQRVVQDNPLFNSQIKSVPEKGGC